jgi:uncharacterized cupin superfamily protein
MSRHPQIVHQNDVTPLQQSHGDKFALKARSLGMAAGSQKLGCTLYQVPPGKAAFPAHVHHANEEAIYILTGTGTMRLGTEQYPVAAGDYIALQASGPVHQLVNTGSVPVEYLAFSTMISPEVVEYPDSGKVGALVGTWKAPILRAIFKKDQQAGYYDGE